MVMHSLLCDTTCYRFPELQQSKAPAVFSCSDMSYIRLLLSDLPSICCIIYLYLLRRSTNTSPGAGATGHTMARSASMALAAQAAAAAALKHQPAPLTPNGISLASPSHSTHDYTPGSFAGSASMSRELPTPETLSTRRAELDDSDHVASGGSAVMLHF